MKKKRRQTKILEQLLREKNGTTAGIIREVWGTAEEYEKERNEMRKQKKYKRK